MGEEGHVLLGQRTVEAVRALQLGERGRRNVALGDEGAAGRETHHEEGEGGDHP